MLGEHYTRLSHAYGLPTVCVRYSNVYGPGQTTRNPYCGVVGKFIDAAIDGRPLTIHGDGEQTRDYTYVQDSVEATVLAAVSPKAIGDGFNIGTGVEVSVNTLAQGNRDLVRRPPEDRVRRPSDIDNFDGAPLSPEKIRVRLGWQPQVRIREGLRRTVDAVRAIRRR